MTTCSSCNQAIGETMLMCPYCGAHTQSVAPVNSESTSSSSWLANGLLFPIWFFATYIYFFVAAAHGRQGLFLPIEWAFALLQVSFPIAFVVSLLNREVAHIPGLLLVAQIASIVVLFLFG